MKTKVLIILVFAATIGNSEGQEIDNQKIGACESCDVVCNDNSRYFRLYSENDFWKLRGATDRYYTNGLKLDVFFLPSGTRSGLLDKTFLVLPKQRQGKPNATRNNNFAVSFGMNQYTPIRISNRSIDRSDRPYAGWMFLAAKCISNDFGRSERLTTEYSVGVIGPAAQQKFVQTKWHELINSPKPQGWDNQIKNDVALNYNLIYDRGIVNPVPNIEMIGNFEANLGTVTNYFGVGTTLRVGVFNDYFLNEFGLRHGLTKIKRYQECTDEGKRTTYYKQNLDRKWQFYSYIKPSFRLVIDNSLLQGGFFSYKRSPYVITADRMNRFYTQAEFGMCLAYRDVGVTFSQLFRTPEFKGAFDSYWGAITVTIRTK